jgi:hypothetical protein
LSFSWLHPSRGVPRYTMPSYEMPVKMTVWMLSDVSKTISSIMLDALVL